jgi:hypothetical protein
MNLVRSFVQNRSGQVLVGIFVLLIVFSLYYFGRTFGDSLAQFLPRFIGLVLICLGAIALGRQMIEDHKRKSGNSEGTLTWILVGAVALSAVSFATTLFGMADFAAQHDGNDGRALVGWFISLGTTFGIQIIMLYIALQLGEQLVRLRPTFDDRFYEEPEEDIRVAPENKVRPFAIGMSGLCIVLGFSSIFNVSVYDVGAFFEETLYGTGQNKIMAAVILFGIAAGILIAFNIIRNVWGLMLSLFLLLVYVVTLSLSSLFSFDSYYKLFQDEEDSQQRRASIIQEETSTMLTDAEESLQDARVALQESKAAAESISETQSILNDLRRKSGEVADALRLHRLENRTANQNERGQLRDEIDRINARRDVDIAKITGNQTGTAGLESELRALESTLVQLEENRDAKIIKISDTRKRVEYLNTQIQCEIDGKKGVDGCSEERSGKPNPAGFLGGQFGRLTIERDTVAGTIPTLQQELNAFAEPLKVAADEVADKGSELALVKTTQAQNEDGQTRAQFQIAEINELADQEVAEIQSQIRQLSSANAVPGASAQDEDASSQNPATFKALDSALVVFGNNPNQETLQAWLAPCSTLKSELQDAGIAEGDALKCAPPRMATMAQRGQNLSNALEEYSVSECKIFGTPKEGVATTALSIDELRAGLAKARGCLNLANQGQEDVRKSLSDLTELESVFLSARTDIRRSVADLLRWADYAVGAAIGAVAVDFMILVVGILAALSASSALYNNPLRPMPEAVQSTIRSFAKHFSEDNTVENGLQRFLRYIEPRKIETRARPSRGEQRDQLFRNTLNRGAITASDKSLVDAIMAAIPLGYLRYYDFEPVYGEITAPEKREAISQSVITMMYESAYISGQLSDQKSEQSDAAAQGRSFGGQSGSLRREQPVQRIGKAFSSETNRSSRRIAAELGIIQGGVPSSEPIITPAPPPADDSNMIEDEADQLPGQKPRQ